MTDIYRLSVEVDSSDIETADDSIDDFIGGLVNAGRKTENLNSSVKKAGQSAKQMAKEARSASAGLGGVSRSAGQAGIQIQQFVGQIQGGQSALVALSQQSADLGIVLGAPMVGVIVSLGAVLVGTLAAAFKKSEEEASDLRDRIRELNPEFETLTENQREFLRLSIVSDLRKQKELISDVQLELEKENRTLSELKSGLELAYSRDNQRQIDRLTALIKEQEGTLAEAAAAVDTESQALKMLNDDLKSVEQGFYNANEARKAFVGYDDEEISKIQYENAIDAARQYQANLAQLEIEEEMRKREWYSRNAESYLQFLDQRIEATAEASKRQQELEILDAKITNHKITESAVMEANNRARAEAEIEQKKNQTKQNLANAFNRFMSEGNKDMFHIGRLGSASMAAVNTYEAASKALAVGGPIAGPAMALTMVAAGIAQVNNIMSQKYGDRNVKGGGGASAAPAQTNTTTNTQSISNSFYVSGSDSASIAQQIQNAIDNGEIKFGGGVTINA